MSSLFSKFRNPIKRQHRNGFTIVELLVVVVVIAILATITIVAYNGITQRANISSAQAAAQQAGKKAEAHKVANGDTYPPDKLTLGVSDISTTYVQYGGGSGYCASSISGTASYYVSHFQNNPTQGACEGAPVGGSVCPNGYIPVPGDSRFDTSTFCVMKYEAKGPSYPAKSQAAGVPWVSISQTNAISMANTVTGCTGCRLITEAEWMTLAANVLSVPTNWSGGSVGSGFIYSGHSDKAPNNTLAASTDDSDGYYGTGNTTGNQRRTLQLTNGATIWDMAGNAFEWTNATIASGQQPGLASESSYTWKEWNNSSLQWGGLPATSRPSTISATVAGYGTAQGVGQLYSNLGEASNVRAFFRGGSWADNSNTGVLTLYLGYPSSQASTSIGFRVTR